jgi:hypothetical protein
MPGESVGLIGAQLDRLIHGDVWYIIYDCLCATLTKLGLCSPAVWYGLASLFIPWSFQKKFAEPFCREFYLDLVLIYVYE